MAKLALTFTLFFFFALTHARIHLDLAQNDVVKDLKEPLPESASNNILLPSQRSESDPANTVPIEPEQLEVDPEGSSESVNTVPLTVITFRPINHRHFPRRPFPLTFRHGHRCHHGHHLRLRLRPSDPGMRSYGHDMILYNGGDQSSDPVLRGGVRQIPARWVKFRHVDEMDSPHHHHHLHHHHRHHHEDEAEHDHGFGSGFLKSFRKFLNHF